MVMFLLINLFLLPVKVMPENVDISRAITANRCGIPRRPPWLVCWWIAGGTEAKHRQYPWMHQPASQDAASRDRNQERNHITYAEPDAGIPAHVAQTKQLHSGTGYNLVIDTEGKVYGTREPYNKEAIMEVTARAPGEVQIRAKRSKFYLAMDERGKIYAEDDKESPNIWFKEIYEDGWNYYTWLGNDMQWFVGINKNGKMENGQKTKKKQKSVKFVPRSATPTYNALKKHLYSR